MVWFTRKPPGGIEIPRLILAAHEIGHYLAFREAGVPVLAVRMQKHGEFDAFNLVGDPELDQNHGYMVALMAGVAGERYWCEAYGQRLPRHCRDGTTFKGDLKEFKAHARQNRFDTALRGLSHRKAIRLAHGIVRDNAKRFRALTEQLARDGELKL